MKAKLTGGPLPALSGQNFKYRVGQTAAVPDVQERVRAERDDCPNSDCSLMPFCRVDLEERTVSAGALCINACPRLPEVVENINNS